MPAIKEIKQRRLAVRRIRKITYAMQVIAQTRLARIKKEVVTARDYHKKIRQLLSDIIMRMSENYHPLMKCKETVKTIGLILINSERGLCGAFNNNIFVQTEDFIKQRNDKSFKFIVIGRRGERFLRHKRKEILKLFFDAEKRGIELVCQEISAQVIKLYVNGELDELHLIYNEYKLNLSGGKAGRLKILPVEPEPMAETEKILVDYLYEPSAEEVLSAILPEYVFEQLYHAFLESRLSEEMTRMMSMKIAVDNADEMLDDLNLSYHKARQALITRELTEITNAV